MPTIKRIEDAALWDDFVEKSPQGTIFSTAKWVELFDQPYEILGYYQDSELVGGIIGWNKDGAFRSWGRLTPFQGILLKDTPGYKYPRVMSLHNEVSKALIEYLTAHYQYIEIRHHYGFFDIRPFLWTGWKPSIYYTYTVSLPFDVTRCEKQTRYEIEHGKVNGYRRGDIQGFYTLYQETFSRKGLTMPGNLGFFTRFAEVFKPSVILNDKAGAVIMEDSKRAYYIFGASVEGHASSYCLAQAFNAITKPEVDLVGCNDERIGLFKRGFGGILNPYYGVNYGL